MTTINKKLAANIRFTKRNEDTALIIVRRKDVQSNTRNFFFISQQNSSVRPMVLPTAQYS